MNEHVEKMVSGLNGLQKELKKVTSQNPEVMATLSEEEKELVDFASKGLDFKNLSLDQTLAKCQELTSKFKH